MDTLKDLLAQDLTDIISEISPNDVMYKADPRLYFRWGQEALKCIRLALLTAHKEDPKSILDLPCGHGRVLRTLKAAFPNAEITACDIVPDAVDFCASVFGAIPIYSQKDPHQICFEGKFDLVWCGSLLTHLNVDGWIGFLNLFGSVLSPGGILLFSTHGRWIVEQLRNNSLKIGLSPDEISILLERYERDGFGYQNFRQMEGYGISVSLPNWVCSQLENVPNLRLLNYSERGWYNHHDVIACIRV